MTATPSRFLQAEKWLSGEYASASEFYEALHQAVRLLLRVDAFYICFYESEAKRLHFVYNVEGDIFDKPETYPLGQGPTSHVIRTGEPLILRDGTDPAGMLFLTFADPSTTTLSAFHWPLWVGSSHENPPDVVVSGQAYEANIYDEEDMTAFAWFAKRTESVLRSRNEASAMSKATAEARLAGSRDQAVADVGKFVEILDRIIEKVTDAPAAVSEIRRRQVELIQWAPTTRPADPRVEAFLQGVTPRELEVLVNVSRGLSNPQVGVALGVSAHTVKRHLDNIYRDRVLSKRSEIIEAGPTIRQLYLAYVTHE